MSRKQPARSSSVLGQSKPPGGARAPRRKKSPDNGQDDDEKTAFFVLRLSPRDRERLRKAAAREFLTASAWVRRAVMRALDAKSQENS